MTTQDELLQVIKNSKGEMIGVIYTVDGHEVMFEAKEVNKAGAKRLLKPEPIV